MDAAGADEDGSIFTMKRRNDGWDNVRDSIDTAIKDRSKAIGSLNEWSEKYVAPAGRWAKVLAEELPVVDSVKSVELPPLPTLPSPSSPAPKVAKAAPTTTPIANSPPPTTAATVSLKERAFAATATLLDVAAKQKGTSKPAAPPSAPSKEVSPAAATVAATNLMLLAGVPVGTLFLLYLLATNSF